MNRPAWTEHALSRIKERRLCQRIGRVLDTPRLRQAAEAGFKQVIVKRDGVRVVLRYWGGNWNVITAYERERKRGDVKNNK